MRNKEKILWSCCEIIQSFLTRFILRLINPNVHIDLVSMLFHILLVCLYLGKKLDMLVNIGVLKKCGHAEWVVGTFIIPKKDGWVQWVLDLWALNRPYNVNTIFCQVLVIFSPVAKCSKLYKIGYLNAVLCFWVGWWVKGVVYHCFSFQAVPMIMVANGY